MQIIIIFLPRVIDNVSISCKNSFNLLYFLVWSFCMSSFSSSLIASLSDGLIYIYGLGISGKSVFKALTSLGLNVIAWDDSADKNLLEKDQNLQGINFVHPLECDWSQIKCVVQSPAIDSSKSQLSKLAKENNCKIVSDIDLFLEHKKSTCIGITGTNGKTTITHLIHAILSSNGSKKVNLGGNCGIPVFSLPEDHDISVLEVSSYQLDLCSNRNISNGFDVRVLTEINPSHLNRYKTFENYLNSKKRFLPDASLNKEIKVALPIDSELMKDIYQSLRARTGYSVISVSEKTHLKDGISILNGAVYDCEVPVVDIPHGCSIAPINIGLAYAACRFFMTPASNVMDALSSFKGLPYRLQIIGHNSKGVMFVNDSKSTNSASLQNAIKSFPGMEIYLICGGRVQDNLNFANVDFSGVRQAFLIGESKRDFSYVLNDKRVDYKISIDLKRAVNDAFEAALSFSKNPSNSVVLFSPGCSSFDQWNDFEERGRAFVEYMTELVSSMSCTQVNETDNS